MKSLLLICFPLFFNSLFSQSKNISDVKYKYLQAQNITMKITKTIKNSNKLNAEILEFYLRLIRIDKKDYEMLYCYPKSVCILKDNSTQQKIKYYNRFTDTFEYSLRSQDEIKNCDQITGDNLTEFENPFSDCFFHFKRNKTKLIDRGNSYSFDMNSNYTGYVKKLWINKTSLYIDSIEYFVNTSTIKISYQYFDKLEYLDDFTNEKIPFVFDSIVQKLKSLPILKITQTIDTGKILNELNSNCGLTLLDFWYIGCEPCIKQFPKIQNLRDSFDETFLKIRSINPGDSKENILYFKSKHDFNFAFEKDTSNLAYYYNIKIFPSILLIDNTGSTIIKIEGNRPKEFNKLVDEIKIRYRDLKIKQH